MALTLLPAKPTARELAAIAIEAASRELAERPKAYGPPVLITMRQVIEREQIPQREGLCSDLLKISVNAATHRGV